MTIRRFQSFGIWNNQPVEFRRIRTWISGVRLPSHRIKWPSELKGEFQNSRTLSIPKTTPIPFSNSALGNLKVKLDWLLIAFLDKVQHGIRFIRFWHRTQSQTNIFTNCDVCDHLSVTFFQIYRKPWAPDRVMAWKRRKLTKSLFPELCAHLFTFVWPSDLFNSRIALFRGHAKYDSVTR